MSANVEHLSTDSAGEISSVSSSISEPYEVARASGKQTAVVIGSGFGGLAAAIRLGAKGYQVTVLERLAEAGGRASVYRQDGFIFDAGPTIITAPFLFEDLWKLCGKELSDDITLKSLPLFYKIRFDDGDVFNYSGDPQAMREEVRRFSPSDVDGYERFLKVSEEIFDIAFTQLGHVPFTSITDMLKVSPHLIRLKSYKTVYQLVSGLIQNEKLRTVFSFHPLLVGGNPFTTTSVYCLIAYLERRWGVHFAMGGTNQLVSGLVKLIEGQGGEVRYNADVERITHSGGRATGVRLTDGSEMASDVVVSNADSATTYAELLAPEVKRSWTPRKLEGARYSMSLFVWYFGTRKQYTDVPHHMLLLGPRYRGLLQDIFGDHKLADDFSLYLHRPTASDSSLAPPGCDAFYVLSPVPHQQSEIDWQNKAEAYRAAIAKQLSATVLPGLESEIATSIVKTPLNFEQDYRSQFGAAFGLEPILRQSAWFRPHNQSDALSNLYLVGAGTHPGAGLPGVLSSARVLDALVPEAKLAQNVSK